MFNSIIPLLGLVTLVALVGLIIVRPIRRAIITRPIFSTYRKVLPQMSDTERDALEAGSVWWRVSCSVASRTGRSCMPIRCPS